MSASRLSASLLVALLSFVRSAFSLATDQDISAMFSSAAQMDAAGNGSAREEIIQDIRAALRSRLAADSATESASHFLELLDEVTAEQASTRERLLRELKLQASKGDTSAIRARMESLRNRYPDATLPSVAAILALAPKHPLRPDSSASMDSCASTGCVQSAPIPIPPAPPAPSCGPGPSARFLRPTPGKSLDEADSALLLTVRIHAPCPLAKLELLLDSQQVRTLVSPLGLKGDFELDDAIVIPPRKHEVAIVACDSFGSCSRTAITVSRNNPIPPWIPWSCGGLVVLGLATGIVALFRRPALPQPAGANAQGIRVRPTQPPPSLAVTGKIDIAQSLRQIIADAEKDLPRGPRVVSRLGALPSIDGDLPALEGALVALLQLPIARAGLRGTVLIATGRGPVSMELVIEDNGPDLDDSSLRQLFDPQAAKLRERQGLDKSLLAAADIVMRHNGHLSAEPRIDGGLRLRLRLPLPSAAGPRATSLLK